MLTDLLEVDQRVFETSANGGHTTEGRSLQLLALEQRLGIFDETDIIAGNSLDKMFSGRNLTQSDSEMVGIVKCVHQVLV
ncbi:hypothetical protein BDV41DRAFT_547827 [Aspergillus transmontanensis]|uniref:Uncharacterized protein n=1 Tax=Aspergillus transmontanensis TaxID=1034304 RepID=A0A5N6VQQ5_9EURO|nr:hypothetical protein BDV41DRAFT_547827 [Aspergillus transmontanensis]